MLENIIKALPSSESTHCEEAINFELESLREHGIYAVVPGRENSICLTTKFISPRTGVEKRAVVRCEARLAVRCSMRSAVETTFAPVLYDATFWICSASAVRKTNSVHQIDLHTGPLHREFDENVYNYSPLHRSYAEAIRS